MVSDDPVDFICQEDKVNQSDSSLEVPFGMRDYRITPILSWKIIIKIQKKMLGRKK